MSTINYVKTENGTILVQHESEKYPQGFALFDDDQAWTTHFPWKSWEVAKPEEVSAEDQKRLGWLFEELHG